MLCIGDTNYIIIVVIQMCFHIEFYVTACLDRKLRETNIRDEYNKIIIIIISIIIVQANEVHYYIARKVLGGTYVAFKNTE